MIYCFLHREYLYSQEMRTPSVFGDKTKGFGKAASGNKQAPLVVNIQYLTKGEESSMPAQLLQIGHGEHGAYYCPSLAHPVRD